ncbi:DUF6099 family protein [Streptomyces sp. NPDC051018]|uniref:DUF6099 family protein n=1 Tax=Streptomyces sp. NPDC051018 TaxID=3365639 RepID=UPI0037B86140
MSIEDRLRDAAHAVDEMWSDDRATRDRLARLRARYSPQVEDAGPTSPRRDAVHLIRISRRALAGTAAPSDLVKEAKRALALAHEIGSYLVEYGQPGLADAVRRAELDRLVPATLGPVTDARLRAERLSGVPDAHEALSGLLPLLAEVGTTMVGVACSTDDEGLYWHCLEIIDAADAMGDRIRMTLRNLPVTPHTSASPATQEITRTGG